MRLQLALTITGLMGSVSTSAGFSTLSTISATTSIATPFSSIPDNVPRSESRRRSLQLLLESYYGDVKWMLYLGPQGRAVDPCKPSSSKPFESFEPIRRWWPPRPHPRAASNLSEELFRLPQFYDKFPVTIGGSTDCFYKSDGAQRTWIDCDSGHFKDCGGLDPQVDDLEIKCSDVWKFIRGFYCEFKETI